VNKGFLGLEDQDDYDTEETTKFQFLADSQDDQGVDFSDPASLLLR
jgi:hypothetical protein